jgi:hypothetical protein
MTQECCEELFEFIELALRGEADGTEAVDKLMELKTLFMNSVETEVST